MAVVYAYTYTSATKKGRKGHLPMGRLAPKGVDGLQGSWLVNGALELPEDKGTYVLIATVSELRHVPIGSLGKFDLIPGFYAYVGSAFGAGGLRARVGHHLTSAAEPHWHIDYLMQVARPVEVWFATAGRKLEHHWADFLEAAPGFRVPIRRFGSSDYHRSRLSHLFYSKRQPSFQWFEQQMIERFNLLRVEQFIWSVAASPGSG